MNLALEVIQNEAADALDRLTRRFKPGVKATLIIRTPGHPDRDFLMTDDDLDEVLACVARRKAARTVPESGTMSDEIRRLRR